MQVWPHPHGWVYASAEVCQARGGKQPKKPMRPTGARQLFRTAPTGLPSGSPTVTRRRLDPPGPQLHTHDVCRVCLGDLTRPRGYTDPLTLESWWHKGVTWAWERDFYLEVWALLCHRPEERDGQLVSLALYTLLL